jgi:hypothetical protein
LLKIVGYEFLRVFPVLFRFGFVFVVIWIALDSFCGLLSVYFVYGRLVCGH